MKILLTGAYKWTNDKIFAVKNLGFQVDYIPDERVKLDCDVSQYDAVVCNGLFLHNDIKSFTNLKLIQATSAGLDRIPVDYVKEHNIKLFNARGVYSAPMAEWAVMRVLEIYKHSFKFYENQKRCSWEKDRELLEISGKTVLVVGTGSVGSEVAKRFSAFDAVVIGADIFKNESPYFSDCVLMDELDSALQKADIVVLTLPLTDETRGMFNKERFSKMKADAVLINIARGAVIDENALVDALNKGYLLGVGLDVFDSEPLNEDSPLWKMKNVLISPHNSFVSDKTSERLFEIIMKNLSDFIKESR